MRISLLPIFIFTLGILPFFSYAQGDASSTASSTESGGFFETILENVVGIKDTVTESPTTQSVLSVATQKRLTNLAANISNRLEGLTMRMRQIASRVGQRIDKQEAAGYNVDSARASLEKSYTLLNSASEQLKYIDKDVYNTFRSQDPKTEWRKVRGTYISARDTIREAHTELKTTVSLLKSATPIAPVATSTATTS